MNILFTVFCTVFTIQLVECQIQRLTKNGCDEGKVCVFKPSNCDPENDLDCESALTIAPSDEEPEWVDIMMQRPVASGGEAHYVAVGFSKDEKMGDDAVTQCINPGSGGQAVQGLSFNVKGDKYAQPLPAESYAQVIKLMASGVINSDFVCHIRQKIRPSANADARILPLDTPYHLMVATGPASGNNLRQHDRNPIPTSVKYQVDTVKSVAGASRISAEAKTRLKKAHGIMMITGWWFFVTLAILFARYFRPMWPTIKPMNKPIWFQAHRALNGFGVIVIASAFICIFIATEGQWEGTGTDPGSIHSILGMTCCVIAFFQPLLALVRPHPDGKFRPIFNWVHRLLGVLAWAIAATTIWYASNFGYLGWMKWGDAPRGMMIFFYVSVVVAVILLEVIFLGSDTFHLFGSNATNQIQMDTVGAPKSPGRDPLDSPSFSMVRIGVLALFVLISVVVVITLACFIGLF